MTTKYRLVPVAGAALLSLIAAGAASAGAGAGAGGHRNATRLPSQIHPTGAEDGIVKNVAPSAASRTTAAAAKTSDPTPEELDAQLVQMTSESSEGQTKVTLPQGGTQVDLEGRFMSVMVATPNKDGGYDVTCQTGEKAVEAAHAAEHPTITAEKMKALAAARQAAAPKLEEK